VAMWVPDETGTEGYIATVHGLFPQPFGSGATPAQIRRVCSRFRFLGQLLAKACRDGFIVPLPLSNTLFDLVCGKAACQDMLPLPGSTGGVVRAYAAVCKRLEGVAQDARLTPVEREEARRSVVASEFTRRYLGVDYDMTLPEYLGSAEAAFVDPISGVSLCAGGDDRAVTVDNLQEFVQLVVEAWLGASVSQQVDAFREGISQVFPASKLTMFSGAELKSMFCGNNTIEWDAPALEQHLHPTANLTRESPSFRLLVEQLQEMTNQERSDFLNFVTACPRLPPGGLGALGIEVTSQRTQSMIPTAQTCVPKLYLPDYPDGEQLRSGMLEAFKNADIGGFHERAMP